MNANKALSVLLLLLAAAAGFYLLFGGNAEPLPVATPAPPSAGGDDPTAPRQSTPAEVTQADRTAGPERAPVTERTPAAATIGDGHDAPQGVRGKVLDPFDRPLPDADVYLVRGVANNVFAAMTLAAKGVVYPPLAHTRTDRGGAFAIGAQQASDGVFELRVFHPRFVEHRMPNLQIVAGQWHELEPIRLGQGGVVHGRVEIAGSGGRPLAGAEVILRANNGMFDLSPIPGLERGLVAQTDANGYYRFDCAPTGLVNIAAVAPKYARVEKTNVAVAGTEPIVADFALPSGLAIAGVVRDSGAAAIPNARVEAIALDGKPPAKVECRADAEGRFEILGLLDGPYRVTATAPGFIKGEVKPVPAGESSLQIELHSQGSARLYVLGLDGRPLNAYRYAVKKPAPGQDVYGNTDLPARSARPGADGVTTVDGLDPGSYAFEIEARGLARAFSEPFTIAAGGPSPLVEVKMDEGGAVEGLVTDASGKPLAGVQVSTLPNTFQDIPLMQMFQGMATYKVTRTSATTDAAGRYRLPLLTPATYQLKFTHAGSFDISLRDQKVTAAQTTTVATVAMERGTIISGVTRVGGQPKPQIKVTISSLTGAAAVQSAVDLFMCETVSDADGKFTLPKPVPPGRYQIMAARQTLPNPLMMMGDYESTKREILVNRGQAKFVLDFQIPADRR